jgi:hypothetical protein
MAPQVRWACNQLNPVNVIIFAQSSQIEMKPNPSFQTYFQDRLLYVFDCGSAYTQPRLINPHERRAWVADHNPIARKISSV